MGALPGISLTGQARIVTVQRGALHAGLSQVRPSASWAWPAPEWEASLRLLEARTRHDATRYRPCTGGWRGYSLNSARRRQAMWVLPSLRVVSRVAASATSARSVA